MDQCYPAQPDVPHSSCRTRFQMVLFLVEDPGTSNESQIGTCRIPTKHLLAPYKFGTCFPLEHVSCKMLGGLEYVAFDEMGILHKLHNVCAASLCKT
mmetsp:Transcript_17068/g.21471  ORF Transcript_17068/g.21471 Transcript_17068/m.21471 type:complete len:97 (-) Transcript_17068:164-454(-)